MQLYFIRHGQSANNLLWDRTGSSKGRSHDPGLTEMGQRQAEVLAQFLSQSDPSAPHDERDPHNTGGFHLTHLYCSLMVRAVATGTVVADALGLPLTAWHDLHETGGIYLDGEENGEPIPLPGNPRAYFEAHYPRLVLPASLDESGWWNRPFEMPEERPVRARRFLNDLLARHGGADDRVAVVSHGGFYTHFMAALLDLPDRNGLWFAINNVAITRIDFWEDSIGLVYSNRMDFLPHELIT